MNPLAFLPVSFLHTGFLVGLLSLALPILFHFFKRTKVQTEPFPTLRFFHLIQKKSSMLFRVGHLLLLLLRLSILAGLVFLFAQPFFTHAKLQSWNTGPRRVVLLFDNSASTLARDDQGVSTRAKLEGLLTGKLSSRDPRDRLTLIRLSPQAEVLYEGPLAEFELARLPPIFFRPADWEGGIRKAREAFQKGQGGGMPPSSDRLLLVASDFQAHDLPRSEDLYAIPARVLPLRPADLPRRNFFVADLETRSSTSVRGRPWWARSTFERGPQGSLEGVELLLEEVQGPTQSVTLASHPLSQGTTSSETFQLSFPEEGLRSYRVRLQGAKDAIPEDDQIPFSVEVVGTSRILVLDGDPRPARIYDEVFYLEKAARAAGLEVDTLEGFEGMERRDPAAYLAMHVANVKDPSRLEGFARDLLDRGGVLVLWVGDQTDPEAFNRSFGEAFLGFRLYKRAVFNEPQVWRHSTRGELPKELQGLRAEKYFQSVHSQGYWFLEPSPGLRSTPRLAHHRDGTPAITVHPQGRGTVVMVNAGADVEDCDLPMHPIYPALVQRFSRLGEGQTPQRKPGEVLRIPVEDERQAEKMVVLTPDGRQVSLKVERSERGLVALFRETREPGIYQVVEGSGATERRRTFEVRRDPSESRLAPLTEAEFEARYPRSEADPASAGTQRWFGLRDFLILLLGLLLLAEALLVGFLEKKRA